MGSVWAGGWREKMFSVEENGHKRAPVRRAVIFYNHLGTGLLMLLPL